MSGVLLLRAFAQAPQNPRDAARFHLATPGKPIAGIPHDEAIKIYGRHAEELRQLPGAVSVSFTAEGLVVETAEPATLPASVEGLPVFAIPPVDPDAIGTLQKGLPSRISPSQPEHGPHPEPPQVVEQPPLPDCPPDMHREPGEVRCRSNTPPVDNEPKLVLNPPPPGVIVLRPGKVREQASACPQEFKEVEGYGGWRFCIDPNKPEEIPPLWSPPINGVPYEKVLEIHRRHMEELTKIPGVHGVGLGADGIHVTTDNPAVVPKEIEGVPIKIEPLRRGKVKPLSHSYNTNVRPLHGAIAIGDITIGAGTLTGVALSDGKPWLVFPSHLLNSCNQTAPCLPAPDNPASLSTCPHYITGNQHIVVQPPTGSFPTAGYAQRWTRLNGILATSDVAAAFMDSDLIEGNGSLSADRKVASDLSTIPFSGITPAPSLPPVGLIVTMKSFMGPPHTLTLRVEKILHSEPGIQFCQGQPVWIFKQIVYTVLGSYVLEGGDSGSPVFDPANRLIGMINACQLDSTNTYCISYPNFGTDHLAIQDALRFDSWYGTQSVTDQSVAAFRPSEGRWYIDNGNLKWDGNCNGTGSATTDQCFQYGLAGNVDRPVTGDWDGDGIVSVGVYRTSTNPQQFLLRNSNSAGSPNHTISTGPPSFGYKPVAGKWNGTSQTKIGVYNPGTAPGTRRGFYLDNGDKVVNGCPPDFCFYTDTITLAEDIPIAGDWNNDGIVSIGVFRPSTSTFYLSNQNPATIPANGSITSWNASYVAGIPSFGYLPVIGEWTGLNNRTFTKLGVFRPSTGGWYLDNGNFSFAGCTDDQCGPGGFGLSGDYPAALDKTIVKAN